jgi:hypothetical protein
MGGRDDKEDGTKTIVERSVESTTGQMHRYRCNRQRPAADVEEKTKLDLKKDYNYIFYQQT